MNTKTKIWLTIATSLTFVGLIIFAIVMSVNQWDFSKLSTKKYQTNEYVIIDEFSSIEINSNTADITILPSIDGENKVICFEDEKEPYDVNVSSGKLSIKLNDQRKWYEHIGIDFNTPKITLYLNQIKYQSLNIKESTGDVIISKDFTFNNIDVRVSTGDVKCLASTQEFIKIKTSTGHITLNNLSAGSLDLTVSTGRVNLTDIDCKGDIVINTSTGRTKLDNVLCKSLISDGDTGDITLKNVTATEKFLIERDTGDVNFENSDAYEIHIETDTGDVKGTILTEKVFITKTDTGKINVPQTHSGGRCEIETDTGDIIISIV